LQETYYKRTMLRKVKINLRKAKILGMYAIDLSTSRPKWRQTPVTAYICLYQELNLKIVEYTSPIKLTAVTSRFATLTTANTKIT